jgi:hypothetical protein
MSDELLRDYSKRYWDSANVVTGFAAAQSLAFLFAYGGNCTFRAAVNFNEWSVGATGVSFLTAMVAYLVAVHFCQKREINLLIAGGTVPLPGPLASASRSARSVRLAVVVVFGLLGLGVLLFGAVNPGLGPGCD